MNNNKYKKIYLVLAIFAIISMFFGGTLAYWQWSSTDEQKTNITLTATPTFKCEADGGGNISSGEKYLVPTDCTNSEYAIQREIKVTPTIYGEYSITMDLWLDVKSIGTGLRNSENLRYALTTEPDSCTTGLVKMGTFKGKNTTTDNKVELFNYMGYNTSTTDTFYLYIWLDKAETNPNTMNQEFNFSLNGMCTDAPEPETYVVFNEEDTTLRLYKRDESTSQVNNSNGKTNISRLDNNIDSYDINKIEDLTITEQDKIYFDLENTTYSSAEQLPWYEYIDSITRVIFEDEIKPKSLSNWFSGMNNVEYIDVSKVNTSKITSMDGIFRDVGSNVTESFEIVGLENWNVSNVTNMTILFNRTGFNATNWSIGDLSNWNVSNVTSMYMMFYDAGYNATEWSVGDLSNWDVSNVNDMGCMFRSTGPIAQTWNIGDLSNWDVSNVTEMWYMFNSAGSNAESFDIGDLSRWDISNITNMWGMFLGAGNKATNWNIGDLSGWNVSNVTNMSSIFYNAGSNAESFDIGDLSGWDVSKVINMEQMFNGSGANAEEFYIGNLSDWNVSSVTNMGWMFSNAGKNATIFDIGDLSEWDTSNVTNMYQMFLNAGYSDSNWSLDLSGWNVDLVTNYDGFNLYVETKITPPVWNTTS